MIIDIVLGNPPYQENIEGDNESRVKSLFNKFVTMGINLSDRFVCMITPTKWISGTQSDMIELRKRLIKDNHIKCMVDFMNSKDCFNSNSIAGGVSYFLYDKQYSGKCLYATILGTTYTKSRNLNKHNIIIRHVIAESIIDKIRTIDDLSIESKIKKNRWSIPTNFNYGSNVQRNIDDIKVITPRGIQYIEYNKVYEDGLSSYKVKFTRIVSEHVLEPSKDDKYTLLSSLSILEPNEICNASYMVLGDFDNKQNAEYAMQYLKSKFVRFLLLQTLFGIGLTPDRFRFIPIQDFTKQWTDKELY